jgi:hypothetical protein
MKGSFWEDGTPKSQRNGFTTGLSDGGDWKKMTKSAAMSEASTARVERARELGNDWSSIYGISRTGDENITRFKRSKAVK